MKKNYFIHVVLSFVFVSLSVFYKLRLCCRHNARCVVHQAYNSPFYWYFLTITLTFSTWGPQNLRVHRTAVLKHPAKFTKY